MNDWQTWTALAVVICTATIMLWRTLRKRKPQ
jgi:ABC-type nickel/cobalt efflux system permease component RcnA